MPTDEVIAVQVKRFTALIDGLWPESVRTHPRAIKLLQDNSLSSTGHLISLSRLSTEEIVRECQRFALGFLYHDVCLSPLLHRVDARPADVITCLWAQGPRSRWTDVPLVTPSAIVGWPDFRSHLWFLEPVRVEGQTLVRVTQMLSKLQSLAVGGIRLHTPWDDGLPLPLSYRGSAPRGLKFLVEVEAVDASRRYTLDELSASIAQAETLRAEQVKQEREQRESQRPEPDTFMQAVWHDAIEREKVLRSFTT